VVVPAAAGGGHLSVRVFHRWAQHEGERDNLLLSVFGRGLDAPLIERLLELPFDIHSGVVDGEIHVAANDDDTWDFPAVTGKLTCKGVCPRAVSMGQRVCVFVYTLYDAATWQVLNRALQLNLHTQEPLPALQTLLLSFQLAFVCLCRC
jgi:hypothetical protein